MKIYTLVLLCSLWFGISTIGFGQGAILFQHFGSADPTAEGFSLNIGNGTSVGPATNDFGMNAWKTASTSGGSAIFDYQQLLTPQQQAQVTASDWMLSVTLRMVQPSGSIGYPEVLFDTGSQYFSLDFGTDGNGDPLVRAGTSSLSPVYTITGAGSSYNNYELVFNSVGNVASLWVDGVDRIDNIGGHSSSSSPGFYWGTGQGALTPFQDYWNLVSLSVPEPSSVGVLLLGSGVLFYLRRKRRH